ncbi:phage integrase N-terminal SAM-like domain-containing protein [Pseudoalteromonas luteoviolacea]|uniref:site-specific integrase n=1 Tax=Pseudoalteromonas luteoviolacea TaxID=43657 RepID=UPI0009BD6243|nr:site-specific integrase [Pseudoalteromonas luteoviolacea]MBQ4810304.1 phage integrase N-terminal SAM-like domain-containing protein [Pseudoalteromonas luteoviolacea]
MVNHINCICIHINNPNGICYEIAIFIYEPSTYASHKRCIKNTISCYVRWITKFIRFHHLLHPNTLGEVAVEQFLSHLANQLNVAENTPAQALNALVYMYKETTKRPLSLGLKFNQSRH